MPTTAATILTASFSDLGVIGEGASLSAALAQDGLTRLNNMVSGWRTQYGTVVAIERTVFNLTGDQQTYTIGLGGDLNVPRPMTILGAGLWLSGLSQGVQIATSIARTGYIATVTATAHGFAVGDQAMVSGANELLYNGLQTVQTVPTVDTFTFTVQGTPATPATGTITLQSVDGQPVEIPIPVVTDASYQYTQIKNLPNGLFSTLYYNPTFPFGTIYLWPRPDTAVNQLVLYLQNVFTGFADINTVYDYPSLPGYAEALQYNLDLRLAIPYGVPVSDEIRGMALETMGLIKRANNRLVDLPNDAALIGHGRWGYNINSDTGG